MLSQRFFGLFAAKERGRPATKKTTLVCETLERRLALAAVSHADSSVVLIDAALMVDIPQQELAGSRVVAIDSRRDAIDQISTALAGLSGIDVLRVISHGSDGSLWFGDQRIDATTLATRADEIAGWGRSLSAGADMLLYGCSVASAGDGSQFVRTLAGLTGADTAANSNDTGLAGDVTLEYQVGNVTHTLQATTECYARANVTLCTRVLWNDNSIAVLSGRNYDWFKASNPSGATDPRLLVMPRGLRKSGANLGREVKVPNNPATWTSRYGSVVVALENLVVFDGMNEMGLAAHAQALSGNFGTRDVSRQGIQAGLLVPYILDNAATVTEALALIPRIQPVGITVDGFGGGVSLIIEDRLGNSAVVEWRSEPPPSGSTPIPVPVAGGAYVYQGRSVRVMANTDLATAQGELRNWPFSVNDATRNTPLPGNGGRIPRFVRASFFSSFLSTTTPRTLLEARATLMSVMRNLSNPIGAPGDEGGPNDMGDETDWRTLSDLTNRTYIFENPRTLATFSTELKQLDFRRAAGVRVLNPSIPSLHGNVTRLYRPLRGPVPGVVGR
jgi:choloylglycine hydrolase